MGKTASIWPFRLYHLEQGSFPCCSGLHIKKAILNLGTLASNRVHVI